MARLIIVLLWTFERNLLYNNHVKYASMFATILLVWVAVILMALTRNKSDDIFNLYLVVMVCTMFLFLIGFARK